jgi:hypothetical protein
MREDNVKMRYVRTTFDTRSPWLLFDHLPDLKERVTYKMYRVLFRVKKDVALTIAEDVQEFLDDERAEVTYDPRYQGLYDERLIQPGNVRELATFAVKQRWPSSQIIDVQATLYDQAVQAKTKRYLKHRKELDFLLEVREGLVELDRGEFKFRGEYYPKRQVKELLRLVEDQLREDRDWLEMQDQKVFIVHYQMALHLNTALADELLQRYRFHLGVQDMLRQLDEHLYPVRAVAAFWNNCAGQPMDERAFYGILETLRAAHLALTRSLQDAEVMMLPQLKNVVAGQPLRPWLLDKKMVSGFSSFDMMIKGKQVGKLVQQFQQVHKRMIRIHFKSLGGILGLEERLGKECLQKWSVPEVVEKVEQVKGSA